MITRHPVHYVDIGINWRHPLPHLYHLVSRIIFVGITISSSLEKFLLARIICEATKKNIS